MTSERKPFHETEYREEDGQFDPILEVVIVIGKNKYKISAYADTGCTTGLSVSKKQVEGIDLGTKISDEPSPCLMADGHIVGADEYKTTVIIDGEEREIVISVVDPTKILGFIPLEKMIPLLGRDFLDTFDVLFKGKHRKIALFKC